MAALLSSAADRLQQKARGEGRLRNHESNEVELTAGELYELSDLMFKAAEALLSVDEPSRRAGQG